MEQINIIYFDMPTTIKAYSIPNKDGTYTIVLNSRQCHEQLMKSYRHELEHIRKGDYYVQKDVNLIEFFAHKENAD